MSWTDAFAGVLGSGSPPRTPAPDSHTVHQEGRRAEHPVRAERTGISRSPRRYVVVAREILGVIAAGRLNPGDRLPNERDLVTITGASRPTVRDALLALDLFGVIEVRPGSGAYVNSQTLRRGGGTSLFDSPPRELLESRGNVEPAVSRLCAGRLPPEELTRLSILIDDCEREGQQAGPDDYEEFLRLSHQFHYALAVNCGNSILADFTSRLVDVTAHPLWMIVNGLHVRERPMRASQIAEHREILAAIAAGDAEEAGDAMLRHLTRLESGIFGRSRTRKSKTIRPRRY